MNSKTSVWKKKWSSFKNILYIWYLCYICWTEIQSSAHCFSFKISALHDPYARLALLTKSISGSMIKIDVNGVYMAHQLDIAWFLSVGAGAVMGGEAGRLLLEARWWSCELSPAIPQGRKKPAHRRAWILCCGPPPPSPPGPLPPIPFFRGFRIR